MIIDLPLIWAVLLAFAVLAYVVLDGFDLGVGMLFPLVRKGEERDVLMNTVAPVWDGNETWLVLGGGGLFAAFPLAYAVMLPALYVPIIAMLLGLVFRGVAFEFRFRSRRKELWDVGFVVGSVVASLSQGIAVGALVQGISVDGREYAGGWFDWLTPFSLFTGLALVAGYLLLGACWLIIKTEGALQARFYHLALRFAALAVGAIAIVSAWSPLLDPRIAERWFTWPAIVFAAPVPVLVALTATGLFRALHRRREVWPFLFALMLFALSYTGLGISLYPNIVPPDISIWEAAAPDSSLLFMLVGAAVLLPLILGYTAYSYSVFRGKVRAGEGYH